MENLTISKNTDSPAFEFNANTGKFFVIGKSFPEDTIHVYMPVLEWLDSYSIHPVPKTIITFTLDYFNSSSYKAILNILFKLEIIKASGFEVEVIWQYHEKDIDMKEAGEEFSELADIPFKFEPR
jgi:hypothetical protein